MRPRFGVALGGALALLVPASSGAQTPGGASGPHPDAPAETAQFAFLVGDWDCAIRQMKPDGSGTNIRSFNPRTRKWDNRWLPASTLQWAYYEAEKE